MFGALGRALLLGGLALVVGVTGCAAEATRQPSQAEVVPASPSIEEHAGRERGLRLVYDVTPGDASSVDAALRLAQKRLDVLLPTEARVAVYRRDARIVVELGPMSEDAVRRVRAGLVAEGGLAVATCDEETDRLSALRALSPPPGIEVRTEVVSAGPNRQVESTYLWSAANPSREAARERLSRWIALAAPGVANLRFGPSDDFSSGEPRPGLRTHVLAEEPRSLGITIAKAEASEGGWRVHVSFDRASATFFGELTERTLRRRLAILVGNEVQSAPVVMEPIKGGSVIINVGGSSAQTDAQDLAERLRLGDSSVRLELAIEETFEPIRR